MCRMSALALLLGLGACSTMAPAPQTAGDGPTYVVYFQEWSAGLDRAADSVIAAAARAAAADPNAPVHVLGAADMLGSAQANIYLSQTRAQVVMDALVQDGLAPSRIVQGARGSVQPVGGNVESRRTTITIGG